jgi:hypothetical protein
VFSRGVSFLRVFGPRMRILLQTCAFIFFGN